MGGASVLASRLVSRLAHWNCRPAGAGLPRRSQTKAGEFWLGFLQRWRAYGAGKTNSSMGSFKPLNNGCAAKLNESNYTNDHQNNYDNTKSGQAASFNFFFKFFGGWRRDSMADNLLESSLLEFVCDGRRIIRKFCKSCARRESGIKLFFPSIFKLRSENGNSI